MNLNTFPTKGNLILAKNSLALATQGYSLMDKKRNILLRELMGLIEEAKTIQSEIDVTYQAATRPSRRQTSSWESVSWKKSQIPSLRRTP